mmetsp:Transcript_25931/g.43997  ORF Transcript_25931/g.43997 Transcript_25931/m.43997 type:complete len:269 (+) Transcript_25931:221-1027(+)
MDPNYIAIEFLCPVCNTLPINGAVLAEDGFFYDRGCIERYFDDDHARSPMTGQLMGKTVIASLIVENTLQRLVECEGLKPSLLKKKSADTAIEGTVCIDELAALARSHLFDEQHLSFDDKSRFYQLTRTSAEQDDSTGKVYQGICLIRGIGVESDWNEGFELIVDVASEEESCDAKDIALYTLGKCYERGVFGFNKSEVKGRKWLDRVESVPSFVADYWGESLDEENPGDVLLFNDIHARSTASTVTELTELGCAECGKNDFIEVQCL